ncbi:phage holin [Corynebacterium freneyi]
MLDQIRTTIPANSRATFYAVAAATVTALVSWGVLDDTAAPAVVGVATAVVTLLFAVVHSDSPWRMALYSLMAAVTVLMTYLGYGAEAQWESVLAVVAPVLGIGTAAATTGGGDYVGEHRMGE